MGGWLGCEETEKGDTLKRCFSQVFARLAQYTFIISRTFTRGRYSLTVSEASVPHAGTASIGLITTTTTIIIIMISH